MIPEQRQRRLLDRAAHDGAVSVAGLADEWGVSRETIRRDIAELARQGLLVKTHGGAVPLLAPEPAPDMRRATNPQGKARIGRAAAALVPDGASVILDSGSTAAAVAANLVGRVGLTVYTPDLGLARTLHRGGARVHLLGGLLDDGGEATGGLDALDMLARYHADFAFVGAGGLTADGALTDFTREGAALRAAMLARGAAAYAVLDHEKFGRVTAVRIAGFGDGAGLITDAAPPPALAARLDDLGVAVTVAA